MTMMMMTMMPVFINQNCYGHVAKVTAVEAASEVSIKVTVLQTTAVIGSHDPVITVEVLQKVFTTASGAVEAIVATRVEKMIPATMVMTETKVIVIV